MYYWRRRLPNALASWFHKRHLFLSLQTPDPNFARRLVVLLDAKLEEVVPASVERRHRIHGQSIFGSEIRKSDTNYQKPINRVSGACAELSAVEIAPSAFRSC